MKIKKLFNIGIITILVISSSHLFGQKYNYAVYEVTMDKEQFSAFLLKHKYEGMKKKMLTKMYDAINKTELSLTLKDNVSVFRPMQQLSIDDYDARLCANGLYIFFNILPNTYLDLKTNTLYRKVGRGDIEHLIKSKVAPLQWEITREEKKVNQFTYKKATTIITKGELIRNIEVWFCPEIPIPSAPDPFYGLPGLVTEVHIQDNDFSCSIVLKEVGYDKGISVVIPLNEIKVLTEEESDALFRGLRPN